MMLFRQTVPRQGEPLREMDVPITREQVADWLNGIDLAAAAPQLSWDQAEFLLQGAVPTGDELLRVVDVMRVPAP